MKKLLTLLIALVFSGLTYGQYLAESFDNVTFPPTGWTQTQVAGTGLWDRVTLGTYPTCNPHSGAAMIRYDSYDYLAAASAAMISPVIDLTTITSSTVLEFWMYRDNGNLTLSDSLSFWINTTASVTGATFLGKYIRIKSQAPVETGLDGWYKYQIPIPMSFNTATNYIILKSYSLYGNSMYIDDIRVLNPAAGNAAPTNMTFTGTSFGGTTVGWTDNSTNEYSFSLYMSTNPTSGFVLIEPYIASTTTSGTGSTYSKTITGLNPTTQYYFRVSANAGLESPYLTGNTTTTAGTLSGVKTVGPTGNYASLTAAFADINTNGLSGNIELTLQSTYVSTVETFPIVPSKGATASKTIKVYPLATGLSITSANANGTLNFDGAAYVTFDGRVNATGTTKDLVISNTLNTSSTIKYLNDAIYNNLKYCTIQGVDSTGIGVVNFGTTNGVNGTANGNSYNKIDNCDIRDGATTPLNAIYASGTSGGDNKFDTISNCNIYNFYRSYACNPVGFYLTSGNTSWAILNNSIYQTVPRNPTGAVGYNIILLGAGENHTVAGNYIGGSAPLCGGTPFTLNGSLANFIYVVRITGATSSTSNNYIQGNTIANISFQSITGTKFAGVLSAAGIANITNNVIGSNTANGSIVFINGAGGTAASLFGLYISAGAGNIQNNIIGGITMYDTSSVTTTVSFYGIYAQGSGVNTISNNIVGSNTVANSIQTIAATATPVLIAGIYTNILAAAGTSVTYTNNIIANITNNNTPAGGYLLGLRNAGTMSGNIIDNNIIHDLSCAAANVGTTNLAAVVGISNSNSGNNLLITRNKIYNLTATAATAAVCVNGIYRSGTNALYGRVDKNLIYNLSINSTATTSVINGIYTLSGTTNYVNNMVRLGYKPDGSSITTGLRIHGIYDSGLTNNFYNNTIYIGGTAVVSADTTYALRSFTTTARNFKDNIFINSRSNTSGTGVNYGVAVAGTTIPPTGLAMDYNIIQSTGTGGVFGRYNLADAANLAAWKTAVGTDTNSMSVDPLLAAPTATVPNLHLTIGSPAESAGIAIDSVFDDIDGDIRANNSPTDIGADAGYYDNIIPTATFNPTNLSTAVALNSTIQVTFNDMVRKLNDSVLTNANVASVISFKKVSDNSNVAFTATWDPSTKKIVATPTLLLGLTTYKFSVVGLEDYNNNVLSGPDSTRFTTIVNSDATLSDLKVNGTTVTGFAPATLIYNVVLPSGTTVVPTVTATTNDINATKVISPASALPGTTTVTTTAQNGTTHLTYIINFTVAAANNATLSDLKVNGVTVTGFASTTYAYSVVLPFGTTVVPTVTATTTDVNATKVITPASALPGTTTVTTTAQDGITHLTYTVNFTIGAASNVATLSDLKVSGTTVTGFSPTVYAYTVTLPYSTTVVPTVTATTTDVNATYVINAAAAIPGTTTVTTTAQNGTTHLTYVVNFVKAAPSTVATLSDLKSNGTTVTGFSPTVYNYNIVLPFGTITVPTVTATTTDVNATKVITPASALPGTTTVTTTAQDGVTHLTYTIHYTVTPGSSDATLSNLLVDGTQVPGFSAATLSYNVVLPFGTTIIPTVTAVVNEVHAFAAITQAPALPGTASVLVTAQDGTTTKTYTIHFTVGLGINEINDNGLVVYPVPAKDIVNIKLNASIQQIAIMNISGQKLSEIAVNAREAVLDIAKLSNGIYFLQIKTSNGILMKKIQVSK
ncbi:MAG: T9SS type A sorting domain-containing protein [Bacteroidetes bacterium]|nr:T9SS type A sorting domain-containing protein [Bacteroidota bacterium]